MPKRKRKVEDEQLIDWKSIWNKMAGLPWFVWAVVLLVFAGGVFYFSGVIISEKISSFEYKNLSFKKEMYGNVMMYHYFYSFVNNKGELVRYNLYLQNDPRKNPASYEGDMEIDTNKAYLSIDTKSLLGCKNSLLAVGKISEFLTNNDFKIVVSAPNLENANLNNVSVSNCETHPDNTVILIRGGDETKVSQIGRCIIIESRDCQVLESVERFMVEAIAKAKARAVDSEAQRNETTI